MEILVTCDPVNINHILCTNVSNFPKGPDFLDIFYIFGDSVFSADYEKVENGLIPLIESMAQQDKAFDLQDLMQRLLFDSTSILVFGIESSLRFTELSRCSLRKCHRQSGGGDIPPGYCPASWWKLQRWMRIGREKEYAEAWETMDNFVAQCIAIRREELSNSISKKGEDEEEKDVDLLTSYIDKEVQDEMSFPISDEFLRDTMLAYLFAGRDTTSAALTWVFWIVAKNPNVKTKIIEELKTIFPQNEGCPREEEANGV
ncbi:alkane hydroxylase MAH1-like [Tasmannia lanceolata]|uniref:alkane hydroxylase MAH1-like n=1 Tax=Tasmannia lanceolata TaxID=3420 RepID=UPI004064B2E6